MKVVLVGSVDLKWKIWNPTEQIHFLKLLMVLHMRGKQRKLANL